MKYEALGAALGKLTDQKNLSYGDSFDRCGEILKVLYPNGISPDQYVDALGITRVIDKFFRLATRKNAFGESPWRDCVGYSLLGAHRDSGEGLKELTRLTEEYGGYDLERDGMSRFVDPYEQKIPGPEFDKDLKDYEKIAHYPTDCDELADSERWGRGDD